MTPEYADNEAEAKDQIVTLARQIKNNKQLRKIIRAARPDLRCGVYDNIVPHLRFKPHSFC